MRWMTYVTAPVCSGWSVQSSAVQNASAVAVSSLNRPARRGIVSVRRITPKSVSPASRWMATLKRWYPLTPAPPSVWLSASVSWTTGLGAASIGRIGQRCFALGRFTKIVSSKMNGPLKLSL